MSNKLDGVLKRMGSRHLAKLWSFFRDSFDSDDSCLDFVYEATQYEPILGDGIYHRVSDNSDQYVNAAGQVYHDSDFIPRRMLNAVERLVSAARDMDQIRHGKDVFKIVFLVTCVETLQTLSGSTDQKKKMLFSFFEDHTSAVDKKYISENFGHSGEDGIPKRTDCFKQFVGVINEYRNCATHEGEYWDFCFNNNYDNEPILLVVKIDLDQYSTKNKKEHYFRTCISYKEFEAIFIRTCISFIRNYVAQKQEEKEHANA